MLSSINLTIISLGNRIKKGDAVWNISPDSILLGVTDTRMNSHFAQSGLVFPQFWVFEAIFKVHGQNSWHFFAPFVPFIVLKTTVLISWFQRKNRFEKRPTLGWDIWEKPLFAGGLVWRAVLKNIFANISAQGGSFSKPIFALKPWDRGGRFEYN